MAENNKEKTGQEKAAQEGQEGQDAQKQQELQKRYMEYQMMEQQVKQMQQQLEKLEQQGAEASAVEQCIEDISKAGKGDEVLVPVTGGVFFKARIDDNSKFLVNVGSGAVVEKDVEGTRGLIQKQREEILKYKDTLTSQLADQMAGLQEMEQELKKLIE